MNELSPVVSTIFQIWGPHHLDDLEPNTCDVSIDPSSQRLSTFPPAPELESYNETAGSLTRPSLESSRMNMTELDLGWILPSEVI